MIECLARSKKAKKVINLCSLMEKLCGAGNSSETESHSENIENLFKMAADSENNYKKKNKKSSTINIAEKIPGSHTKKKP